MRITLHLDTFDKDPCAYAILWVDDEQLKWSREAHVGLPLPEWGIVRTTPTETQILDQTGKQPLCTLEGLELGQVGGPFEGEIGKACWCAPDSSNALHGDWHVQCLDSESTHPEFGLFADDQPA